MQLQHTATHCTTLHHTATRCNTLQHSLQILAQMRSWWTSKRSVCVWMRVCGCVCVRVCVRGRVFLCMDVCVREREHIEFAMYHTHDAFTRETSLIPATMSSRQHLAAHPAPPHPPHPPPLAPTPAPPPHPAFRRAMVAHPCFFFLGTPALARSRPVYITPHTNQDICQHIQAHTNNYTYKCVCCVYIFVFM